MMLVNVLHIVFVLLKLVFATSLVTVNDFPLTEKLNYDGLRQKWVQHNVKLESIPLNRSFSYSSSVGNAGKEAADTSTMQDSAELKPFICYDFESCNVISTRVTRSKRLKLQYIPIHIRYPSI